MRSKRGFTLVEILIVVVILGILAAIVIPQFTEASTEARESRLQSDLQMLRSQIELYKVQHNDVPPALATFVTQLTQYTSQVGAVSATKDATHKYGPYLTQMPTNPFNDKKDLAAGDAGDNSHGWHYTEASGAIKADDSAAHAAL